MCFDVNEFAFLYGDYEYFAWFAEKSKEHLEMAIIWKRLRGGQAAVNINAIWNEQEQNINIEAIERGKHPVVTRAFLFHLADPIEYPIFDSNAHRAMREHDEEYRTNTRKTLRSSNKT